MANRSKRFAIFIDGEFWHGYKWQEKKPKIKSNRGFWIPKIERNMQRDREVAQKLKNLGFSVFRFWEHEVKENLEGCINKVVEYVNQQSL
jgi:DNA mismatch endonuclease (patch repair protein)